MQILLIISILLISTSAFSRCKCNATKNGNYFFQQDTESSNICKQVVQEEAFRQYKNGLICNQKHALLNIEVSCEKENRNSIYKSLKLSCEEFEGMLNAESIIDSLLYTTAYTKPENIDPMAEIKNDVYCEKDTSLQIAKQDTKVYPGDAIKLVIKNRDDLISVIQDSFPNLKGEVPGAMLDKIEDNSLSVYLHNDNNLADLEKGGDADDMGDTHGLKLTFSRAIANGEYVVDIEYESRLFTNFKDPTDKGFYKDTFGNWHVDQLFIEENIGKVVLRKQKNGDAYYWSVAGGVHQLNKDNGNGTLGIFSALGSQVAFHKKMSEIKPGSARLYNNIGQSGSETEAMVEGKIGKRFTMTSSVDTRTFLEAEAQARLTGVNDASYVGVRVAPYADYQLTRNVALRAGVGLQSKFYSDGSRQSGTFFEVVAAGKSVEAGFKYEMYNDGIPTYQNPLPNSMYNKEEKSDLAPPNENIWTIYFKAKY
jgi:hypothetical protein